ncbi:MULTISPECIES: hypothetical protein [Arthrobacter]|uniref:Uncharacterized protein n=1 Tax=Arthrobacter terricola TaxID=2547396 RepID=A0A4R5K652_9MICC|nr:MULTISPECIES: hypothetical protein [Arthrobacter]MBT8163061.1 hypothetical protein [Arthrobacter sp. GN70]TDF88101.1 hypothetical protein E1809_24080 [Arthrobacter terricola]
MIRKQGKARWTYECAICEVHVTAPDQFRAIEACHRHEKTAEHAFKMIGKALQPVVDRYMQFFKSLLPIVEQFQKDYALVPPSSLPHDPTMLRDRRKWGGR